MALDNVIETRGRCSMMTHHRLSLYVWMMETVIRHQQHRQGRPGRMACPVRRECGLTPLFSRALDSLQSYFVDGAVTKSMT